MKSDDYFNFIMKIILFLLAILIIYWLVQILIDRSPHLSQINSALIIMLLGLLLTLYKEFGEVKAETKYNFQLIKDSFNKIKEDMFLIKEDLSKIKNKLKIK